MSKSTCNMTSNVVSDYSIETILSGFVLHQREIAQPTSRRRRARTVFPSSAVKYMEQEFDHGKYPDVRRREAIAAEIGVSEARVQVWFQNRRARNNKRRNSNDPCPDVHVKTNTVKRRRVEHISGSIQESGMARRHSGMVPTPSQSYTSTCHPMYPLLYHAYPMQYNQQSVLPSLWNLSKLNTTCQQKPENEVDESDDFVKRLFRFSERSAKSVEDQHKVDDNHQRKIVRMVVPTKKATDCSVTELRTTERTREVSEEFGFTLEEDDSGLANDSFSDSL